jgi:hypothetical protein
MRAGTRMAMAMRMSLRGRALGADVRAGVRTGVRANATCGQGSGPVESGESVERTVQRVLMPHPQTPLVCMRVE